MCPVLHVLNCELQGKALCFLKHLYLFKIEVHGRIIKYWHLLIKIDKGFGEEVAGKALERSYTNAGSQVKSQ